MEITDVKIRKIMSEGRLRAVVSVTIDDMFAVHDIKVVQGDERLFVAMPSRKDENGIFRDIVHPISPSARKLFEESILDAYERQKAVIAAEEASDGESEESGTTEE
ncbi:MAG: septation regulator SpoVG [Ruminococcus sp.]|jgi:stage V sporulation protein G|nr:septation regulator SpoVG [Ruminococcus sp.]